MAALAEDATSQIDALLSMYGGEISPDALRLAREAYAPVTESFDEITVHFREVIWDGRWLYSAVEVVPNDADAVLVMPGSAWEDDRVSGGYGEGERDDDRSFLAAAREDGKTLLSVYVYPEALDELPEYFLDHFQRAGDVSVLMSGGRVEMDAATLETAWHILTIAYDTQTGEPLQATRFETTRPLILPRLGTPERQTYATPETGLPFDTAVLTRTPLTTYVDPAWRNEEDAYDYDLKLMKSDDTPYAKGASQEVGNAMLATLPQTLLLRLENNNNGHQTLVTLTATEEQ